MLIIAFEANKEVFTTYMSSLFKQEAKIIELPRIANKRTLGIVREVKLNVEVRLNFLLDGLAENVADALFEEMWELDEQDALKHHFNVMRALKLQSGLYRKEFYRLLDTVWLAFLRQEGSPVLRSPRGNAGTLINSYNLKTASYYKIIIKDLRLRFSTLITNDWDDYPLRPEIFYYCFWQSIEKLELKYDERVMLIPLFQRFVMDRYGQLLAIANKTLIDHGITSEPERPIN